MNLPLPVALELLIYALAVARVSGLVTQDSITESSRDRLLVWLDGKTSRAGAFLAALIQCPWCVSMWVAGAVVPLIWFYGQQPVMLGAGMILALSQVTGMIHNLGR